MIRMLNGKATGLHLHGATNKYLLFRLPVFHFTLLHYLAATFL